MKMMKELKFYRTDEGAWFVDLPAYVEGGGDPAELQMVAGADDFLDVLSGGKDVVILQISEQKIGAVNDVLKRVDEIPTFAGRYYMDMESDTLMWLCNVTLWVFGGRFPEHIWYKKLKDEEHKLASGSGTLPQGGEIRTDL
jgi:hypothetical protein